MTQFVLGINTCFAVKRWPEPEAWARVVREQLGLDAVQHSLDLVDLDAPAAERRAQAAAVAEACRRHGLVLHSTFTGLAAYSSNLLLHPDPAARRRARDWYRRAIEFTADAGGRSTGGHVGAYSVADFHDAARRAALGRELIDHLRALAAYACRTGLQSLMVENLAVAREPATMEGVEQLLTPGDTDHVPITLCLDVGHQCVAGTSGADRDPYEWLRRFGASAEVVQLQQSDASSDHHWAFTEEHNGAGRIEGQRVLSALTASGASQATLMLEIIPPFEQDDAAVVTDLVDSAVYWRGHLERLGTQAASAIR